MSKQYFGFDIETTGPSSFKEDGDLCCASIYEKGKSKFIVNCHPEFEEKGYPNNYNNFNFIVNNLANPNKTAVVHNVLFDITFWEGLFRKGNKEVFNSNHRRVKCNIFCTMIGDYLVSPDEESYTLDSAAARHLKGQKKIELEQKITNPFSIPLKDLRKYNKQDAKLHYLLKDPILRKLEENGQLLLFNWLMKIAQVFINIQIRGVKVDTKELDAKIKEYEQAREKVAKNLKKRIGDVLLTSPLQLTEVLYNKLELPIVERTTKGNPSTGVDALSILKRHDDVSKKDKTTVEKILEFRKYNKILSTYFHRMYEKDLCSDGRVHSHYFIAKGSDPWYVTFGTVTGRSSSKDPNLQNFPKEARGVLCADEGYKLFQADYSQLELRVAAYLSQDPNMLKVFRDKLDIHNFSTAAIFDKDYKYVEERIKAEDKDWVEKRRICKTFNFAMIYGAGWFKLQKVLLSKLGLSVPKSDINRIKYRWEDTYFHFTEWKNIVHGQIKENGWIVTDTGRRRYFFNPAEIENYDWKDIAQFQREGLNDLIQSLANEINFIGLALLEEEFKSIDAQILLTVHDSIDGQYRNVGIKKRIKDVLVNKTKEVLLNDFDLIDLDKLILDVDIKLGERNWS